MRLLQTSLVATCQACWLLEVPLSLCLLPLVLLLSFKTRQGKALAVASPAALQGMLALASLSASLCEAPLRAMCGTTFPSLGMFRALSHATHLLGLYKIEGSSQRKIVAKLHMHCCSQCKICAEFSSFTKLVFHGGFSMANSHHI